MKRAADFRADAREALRGKWRVAILTGFVASLIGAAGGSSYNNQDSTKAIIQDFQSTEFWMQHRTGIIAAVVAVLAVFAIWAIITIVISGAGKLGYAVFNLNLVDKEEASLSDLFSQFDRLGTGFLMNFLLNLYTLLWTLLFIIPGIIKGYSYSMTPYILAENPGMSVNEAITESRRIMDGNKERLFCLQFSFIGWESLCAAPTLIVAFILFGLSLETRSLAVFLWLIPASIPTFIGNLFLMPYLNAAKAAFYREVSGTKVTPNPTLPEGGSETI